jgi:hypothetical protein
MNILSITKRFLVGVFFFGGLSMFGLAAPAQAQYEFYFNLDEYIANIEAAGGYVEPAVAGGEEVAAVANAAQAAAAGEGSTVNGLTAEEWLAIAAAEAGQGMCLDEGYGEPYCSTIAAPIVTRDGEGRITQIVCGNGTVFNFTYGGGGTPPPVDPSLPTPTCADYNLSGTYPDCYDPNPPVNPSCADYNMLGIYPDCYSNEVVVAVPTCADQGLSGEYPFCFDPNPPTDPSCADYGMEGVYPGCFIPPVAPPVTMTLKICQNSCSSNIEPPSSFSMSKNDTKNLVACYNSATDCTDSTGDVTTSATWTEGGGNPVTLSQIFAEEKESWFRKLINKVSAASLVMRLRADNAGTESIQASYGGNTVARSVTVTCTDSGACQRDGRSQSLCAKDNFTVTNNCGVVESCAGEKTCDYNWKEVTP